jgi:hypothetical protein
MVLLPPNTIHGIIGLSKDAEAEVIGEFDMGEWVTVIHPDGSRHEVEVFLPGIPWHRKPPAGTPMTEVDDFLTMMDSTAHLL